MDDPLPPPDWSESDQRTQDMIARLKGREDPITAGLGLGMNGRSVEALGAQGSTGAFEAEPLGTHTATVLLAANGVFAYGNVVLTEELGTL